MASLHQHIESAAVTNSNLYKNNNDDSHKNDGDNSYKNIPTTTTGCDVIYVTSYAGKDVDGFEGKTVYSLLFVELVFLVFVMCVVWCH